MRMRPDTRSQRIKSPPQSATMLTKIQQKYTCRRPADEFERFRLRTSGGKYSPAATRGTRRIANAAAEPGDWRVGGPPVSRIAYVAAGQRTPRVERRSRAAGA